VNVSFFKVHFVKKTSLKKIDSLCQTKKLSILILFRSTRLEIEPKFPLQW